MSRERWSFQLAPHLTGKAQQAYAALPPEDAKTYDMVKEAILRRYDINEETYRQRFRKLRPKEGEPPQELITCLKDLATRWARERKSREELLDLIVREQFLAILPEHARISVIERQPKGQRGSGSGCRSLFAGPFHVDEDRRTTPQPMSIRGVGSTDIGPGIVRSLGGRAATLQDSRLRATRGRLPGVPVLKEGTFQR